MNAFHSPHHWIAAALVAAAAMLTLTDVHGQGVRDGRNIVPRDRDSGIAKEERSPVKKTKRAAKKLVKQSRHGVASIDATQQH